MLSSPDETIPIPGASTPEEVVADALPLPPGQHPQGAEHLHLDQPPRGVKQAAGEHDVPGDLPVDLGDQREAVARRDAVAQRVDQIGDHGSLITERLQLDTPHGFPVTRLFLAKIHAPGA
jgi:hypothetical protein